MVECSKHCIHVIQTKSRAPWIMNLTTTIIYFYLELLPANLMCMFISHPYRGSSLVSVLMLLFIPWLKRKQNGKIWKFTGNLFLRSKCQVQIARIHLMHKSAKQKNPTLIALFATIAIVNYTKWITMRFILAATTIAAKSMFRYAFIIVSLHNSQFEITYSKRSWRALRCVTIKIFHENTCNLRRKLSKR